MNLVMYYYCNKILINTNLEGSVRVATGEFRNSRFRCN
jgi:hypothetical protein